METQGIILQNTEKQELDIVKLMKSSQLKSVQELGKYSKMTLHHFSLLSKYITGDFINSNDCVIYTGQISGKVCIMSFKGNKVSVCRLMYINFVGNLTETQSVTTKETCQRGCCNVKHFVVNESREYTNESKGVIRNPTIRTIVNDAPSGKVVSSDGRGFAPFDF